jgi:hypothetical protein
MQTLKFLVLILAAKCCCAAVPASVGGNVIYLSLPMIHGEYSYAFALGSDGVATGLFTFQYVYPGPAQNLSPPTGGPYSYRRIDDASAELIVAGQKYTLRFTPGGGDSSGNAAFGDTASSFYGFRLARIAAGVAMTNCSNRSFVRPGGSAFTGFVISDHSHFVLIRAVGPGLAQFSIPDLLATPRLKVVLNSSGIPYASNEDWRTASPDSIRNTGAVVGAFPLSSTSADSAVVLSVGGGAYVVEVSSANPSDSGQVLIEVYVLP